jgi:hypothetical protein
VGERRALALGHRDGLALRHNARLVVSSAR